MKPFAVAVLFLLSGYSEATANRRSLSFASFLCRVGLPSRCVCTESGLRSAIVGGGSVTICSGTLELTSHIDLTGISVNVSCARGSCQLDGGGITRMFSGAPLAASFSNIIFTAGNGINENILRGGVFYMTGGSLELEGCELASNRAESGGAISAEGSSTSIVVRDSSFTSNSGVSGGAIYLFRSATVQLFNTAMSNNVATNGVSVFVVTRDMRAVKDEMSNNTYIADEQAGGAVYTDTGVLVVSGSTFLGNQATLVSGTGGAVFSVKSSVDLLDTVFARNTAGDTGAAGDDVFISDNLDPAVDGSFVQCSIASAVVFCGGLNGVVEFGGSDPFDNTNCDTAGVTDPDDSACVL